MLSIKKVTLVLFLLLEKSRQEGDERLANCQAENYISVDFNKTVISIDCFQNNIDLVENDIKCTYGEYKVQHGKKPEVGQVSSLEISECRLHSNLTIKTILNLLEVPVDQIKSINLIVIKYVEDRVVSMHLKAPFSFTHNQLTGLQSVTKFGIFGWGYRFNLETLIALPHLKQLSITSDALENISNKHFGQLENLNIQIKDYSCTGNKNILQELMSMSDNLKIFELLIPQKIVTIPYLPFLRQQSFVVHELCSFVIKKESFGNNRGLEVLKIATTLLDKVERHAFDNLQNLKHLTINLGKITTIHPELLPSSLKYLDVSNNRLISFIGGNHLTNLEELILNNNEIETVDAKTLPSSLRALDLSGNRLRIFIGRTHLANLEKLRLNSNYIENFDAKTLSSSLRALFLSSNRLTSFIGGTHLTNLGKLHLNGNQFETFDTKTLPSSLRALDLSGNRLRTFIGRTHLANLEKLRLNSNYIETFDAKTLSSSLRALFLSSNRLTSFIGGTHLTNLGKLHLNGNQFETFDTKSLPSSLRAFDLSGNRLRTFIGRTHLANLEKLRLNSNYIETFDAKTLPSSLKILDLSSNQLTSFFGGTHLKNLVELHLNRNQFETFDTNSLPSSLKHLHLKENKLKEFVIEKNFSYLEKLNLKLNAIFSFTLNLEEMSKLRVISLAGNHLKWLKVIGRWTSSLKEVNLDNNDIQNLDAWQWIYEHQENISYNRTYPVCDCNLQNNHSDQDFYKWIMMKECQLPIPDKFITRIYNFKCLKGKRNQCTDLTSSNIVVINCSDLNWPQNDRAGYLYGGVDTFHIYLSDNENINFFPRVPRIQYRNSSVNIYAENCRITPQVLVKHLMKIRILKRLHIANNNISVIEVSDLQMLEKMGTKLTLSGNPLQCDCDHQLMYDTITQIRPLIEDYDRMTCSDGSKFIPNRSLCFQWQTLLWSLTVIALILAFGLAILYNIFSLEVKIFIYSRGWFPAMFRPDLDGQTFVYDVFVSYSELDEDYVYSIIDFLEHDISPPLKVCHHNRDWIGGDRIDRQIINSVEASRKTLIIFSRNFLTSYWGSLEFRTAFLTMLHEKTSKLVLVVYGDLGPLDELKPEIRSYIKTTTYIASDNKWFWKRLAYALRSPKDAKMDIEEENDKSRELTEETAVVNNC